MSNPFTSDFDSVVNNALEEWHIPGVSFSVVHGKETWSNGYGAAQLEPRKEVDSKTLFYAGSMTKAQLCATWAIYIASSENQDKPKHERISWDTPLADIVGDDFVLEDPIATRQVTLEDAVSHRTGMPRHELNYGIEGPATVKGVTRNLRNLPLHNTIRTNFEYCNLMYMAATHALEAVTGKPWAQVVKESLWDPLDMNDTYAGYAEAKEAVEKGAVLAKGHTWSKVPQDPDYKEGHIAEHPYMEFPEVSGAGFIISTADDYTKWVRCLLSAASPLSEDIRKEIWKPRMLINDMPGAFLDGAMVTYSLGWFEGVYRRHKVYYHPGGLIGGGALVLLVPDLDWGVSLFTNGQVGPMIMQGAAVKLLDDVLGVPKNEQSSMKHMEVVTKKFLEKDQEEYKTRRSRLYPGSPEAPEIPHALALEQYQGAYNHPGYGAFTFEIESTEDGTKRLYCQWQRTWPTKMYLEHVNAESWLATATSPDSPLKKAGKAESKIGADGKVEGFNIAMEPTMPDTMMWFARSS